VANTVDQLQLAEQLVEPAKEQGTELIGPNGLLNQLTKNVVEAPQFRVGQVGQLRSVVESEQGGQATHRVAVADSVGDDDIRSVPSWR
jgi:hypothetical protein